MQLFVQYMRIRKFSEETIEDRVKLLHRLETFLGESLLSATTDSLIGFQATVAHLAPASVHVYTRHIRSFYLWARKTGLIAEDPAVDLELPRLGRGRPHPTPVKDLRTIFACASGRMRTAYMLATFAGLRCGEICRLHSRDLDFDGAPTALIHGKGGKERIVPLIPPIVSEIGYLRGFIITTNDGRQVQPARLSDVSTQFLAGIGVQTTLHSMRHAFATSVARITHDSMFVRDLLGHESLATTEVYMQSSLDGAHMRLSEMSVMADQMLRRPYLAVVHA